MRIESNIKTLAGNVEKFSQKFAYLVIAEVVLGFMMMLMKLIDETESGKVSVGERERERE